MGGGIGEKKGAGDPIKGGRICYAKGECRGMGLGEVTGRGANRRATHVFGEDSISIKYVGGAIC